MKIRFNALALTLVFSTSILSQNVEPQKEERVKKLGQVYEVEEAPKDTWTGRIAAAVGSIMWSNFASCNFNPDGRGEGISEFTGYLGAALSLVWTPFVADGTISGIWNGLSNYLIATMGIICMLAEG